MGFVIPFSQSFAHSGVRSCAAIGIIKVFLLLALLNVFLLTVNGECCGKSDIHYTFRGFTPCSKYGGRNEGVGGCVITVCGDGKPVQGSYCGKGPCNIFGCNCDGGCIEGNARTNFLDIHGRKEIYNVYET